MSYSYWECSENHETTVCKSEDGSRIELNRPNSNFKGDVEVTTLENQVTIDSENGNVEVKGDVYAQ